MGCIVPVCPLFFDCFFYILEYQRFFFCRTYADTAAAAGTIHGAYLNAEGHAFKFFAIGLNGYHTFRFVGLFFCVQHKWTHAGVWTYIGALVALNAVFRFPLRYINGNHTFFITGSTHREGAVFTTAETADWQFVALLRIHRVYNLFDECRCSRTATLHSSFIGSIGPGSRYFYFMQCFYSFVYCCIVHVYYIVALFAVGLFDGSFQQLCRFFKRNDVGQLEECSLGYHVDSVFQTNLFGYFYSVDGIELNVIFSNIFFHFRRQFFFQLCRIPWAVQKEGAARFQAFQYFILVDITCFVASNIVSLVNQIGRTNLGMTKAQMGYGNAAGLFGVVGKVSLGIHIGVVPDNFDGIFIGADSTIGAVTPEFAADCAFRCSHHRCAYRQTQISHIVHNADGETVFRCFRSQVFIYGNELCRCDILRA